MSERVIKVSPSFLSEMQEKSIASYMRRFIYPDSDDFADWMHEVCGCEYGNSYKVEVVYEWGTERKFSL